MKRLIILAAAVAVVAAACAERGPHVVGAAPTGPSPAIAPSEIAVTATATASGPVEVPSVSFQLWFTRNDHLFEIPWVVPETKAVGTASLEALLGGPPNPGVAEGVGTQIPPGTSSHSKLRIKGRGIERGKEKGDEYVVIKIIVPKDLDEEDKELVKKLQQKHSINARADVKW